ncbi:ATP-binding cassette domain-containing protein [Acinetobacter sp. B5B]|uniref:taurine ABC transporter ATP-binding protein n=1 Tax=Acinetobacter baretiae TaxID=2605383 RepID=UPI0018C20BC7|nr:ATP-binding cassette domain-containing protein [Acinetobacter baretiae]MBF7681825.1 ATP-binding cassette domain-containing protein [Acinetobacter baretiae]MBF7685447.1 ATP-binding cassette domain-containing protein [Acinetobacter baretiae]
MSTLTANHIGLTFPTQIHPILEDIHLEIASGSLTTVLGESGCGKTTLLNILAGFQSPTTGQILLDHQPLHGPDASRAVVFQEHALFPWLNVQDNVAFSLEIQKIPSKVVEEKVAHILKIVGLDHVAQSNIWELSGGMKQRVGIARALISPAAFMLLDEPFAALDAFTRENMQQLVLDLWVKQKRSFFLITHDIEEALLLSETLIIMQARPGRITKRLTLDFSHRYRDGENIRSIKSDPQFIELREALFSELSHDMELKI